MLTARRRGAVLAAASVTFLAAHDGAARVDEELRSYFVERTTGDGLEFTIVEPAGRDVRVRVVRLSPAHEACPAKVVRAVEGIVPRATVRSVADVDMCDMTQERVERALSRYRARDQGSGLDWLGSVSTVVASCAGGERRFTFQEPPVIDQRRLRRRAGGVARVWAAGERAWALVTSASPRSAIEQQAPDWTARERLGTALVPELVAGPYGLAERLAGYHGPPLDPAPFPAELLEKDTLRFLDFAAPPIPVIAWRTQLFGDVRLRLSVDSRSGAVTGAAATSGNRLLADAAIDAARRWRLDPASRPGAHVDVTLRFQLRCPPAP